MTILKSPVIINSQGQGQRLKRGEFYINIPLPQEAVDPEDPVEVDTEYEMVTDPVGSIDAGTIPTDMNVTATLSYTDPEFENSASESANITWSYQWFLSNYPGDPEFSVYIPEGSEDDPFHEATVLDGETSSSLLLDVAHTGMYPVLRFSGTDPDDVLIYVYASPDGEVKVETPAEDLAVLTDPVVNIDGDGTVTVGNKVTIMTGVFTKNGVDPYTFTGADETGGWLQFHSDPLATTGWTNKIVLTNSANAPPQEITADLVGSYLRILHYGDSPVGDGKVRAYSAVFGPVLTNEEEPDDPDTGNEEVWDMILNRSPTGKAQGLHGSHCEQHFHCGDRSGDHVVIGQDVSTLWYHNGEYWRHCRSKGTGERKSVSVTIDQDSPQRWIYAVGEARTNFSTGHGLYLTNDFGESFTQVLGKNTGLTKRLDAGSRSGASGSGGKFNRHSRRLIAQDPDDSDFWLFINPHDAIYTSTDDGLNWTRRGNNNVANMGRIFAVYISTADSDVACVAAESGFWRSDNIKSATPTFTKRGASDYPNQSTQVSGGITTGGDWCTSLDMHPTNGELLMVVWQKGVYKSTDNGNNWTRTYNDSNAAQIAVHKNNRNYMWLVGTDTKPKRSTSGPSGFQAVANGVTNNEGVNYQAWKTNIKAIPTSKNSASGNKENNIQCLILPHDTDETDVVGYGGAIAQKYKAGQNRFEAWCLGLDTLATGQSNNCSDRSGSIAFHPTNPRIMISNTFDLGAMRTLDGWQSYEAIGSSVGTSNGKSFNFFGCFQRDDPRNYVCNSGMYDGYAGVQTHTDITGTPFNGSLWKSNLKDGQGNPSGANAAPRAQWVAWHPSKNEIYSTKHVSRNGGTGWDRWNTVSNLPQNGIVFAMDPTDGDILWAHNQSGTIWRTEDGGRNWNQIGSVPVSLGGGNGRSDHVSIHPANNKKLLVRNGNGGVSEYTVNSGGTAWDGGGSSLGLNSFGPGKIFICKAALELDTPVEIIYAFKEQVNGAESILYRNIDRGGWEDISYDLPRTGANRSVQSHDLTGDLIATGTVGSRVLPRPSAIFGATAAHGNVKESMVEFSNLLSKWVTGGTGEPSDPVPDINAPPASHVTEAKTRPLITFNTGGSGVSNPWHGPAMTTVAMDAYVNEATSSVNDTLDQLRHCLSNNREPCQGGDYAAQHDIQYLATAAIAKHTPAIWDQLTNAEKRKLDVIMEGECYLACGLNGSLNANGGTKQVDGTAYQWTYNTNHRLAKAMIPLVAGAYFGQLEMHDKLRDYVHADFRARCVNEGFNNLIFSLDSRADMTINQWQISVRGGSLGNSTGWRSWYNTSISQPYETFDVEFYEDMWGNEIVTGIGAGDNGINVNGTQYGTMISGQGTMPYSPGTIGGAREFDAQDGGGQRSSMGYVAGGWRPAFAAMYALMVAGQWDPNNADAQRIMQRTKIGMADIRHKLVNGYRDYQNGGIAPNNQGIWQGITSGMGDNFGMLYSLGMWEDVIAPYHNITPG